MILALLAFTVSLTEVFIQQEVISRRTKFVVCIIITCLSAIPLAIQLYMLMGELVRAEKYFLKSLLQQFLMNVFGDYGRVLHVAAQNCAQSGIDLLRDGRYLSSLTVKLFSIVASSDTFSGMNQRRNLSLAIWLCDGESQRRTPESRPRERSESLDRHTMVDGSQMSSIWIRSKWDMTNLDGQIDHTNNSFDESSLSREFCMSKVVRHVKLLIRFQPLSSTSLTAASTGSTPSASPPDPPVLISTTSCPTALPETNAAAATSTSAIESPSNSAITAGTSTQREADIFGTPMEANASKTPEKGDTSPMANEANLSTPENVIRTTGRTTPNNETMSAPGHRFITTSI